jgi:hypothetical protein
LLGLAFEHEDIRGSDLLVQQDLALGCNTYPYLRINRRWTFMGRSKEGVEELSMGFIDWLKKVLSYDLPIQRPPSKQVRKPQMNEGDFHSGPEGYSPSTPYPETFYGSGGSSDHGHDEGDFNR